MTSPWGLKSCKKQVWAAAAGLPATTHLYAASAVPPTALQSFVAKQGSPSLSTVGLPAAPQHQVRLCMSIQVQVDNSGSPALTDDQSAGLLH